MPKLTDIAIKQLPLPRRGQQSYYDDLSGFGVRISQGGARTFFVLLGSGKRHTIGKYPVISLSEARTEAKRLLAERTLGKTRPTSLPYEDGLKLFLSSCQQRNKPRTVSDYRRILNRHFRFGRKRLCDITPQDVATCIDRLRATPSEANHAHITAKVFFNWARRSHYLDRSPLEGTLPPARTLARERVLNDKELAAVFRAALGGDDNFSNIVALLVLTGARRGEIASLRWDYIAEENALITLPTSVTKNARVHALPYGRFAAHIFERVPRVSEYLFPASRDTVRGKPTTIFNGWGKAKADFDKRCSVDFRLHDLRRTFATNLAALGTPIQVTEKLLNHVSGSLGGIVAIYNRHSYLNEMREAIRLWEAKLKAVIQ